MKKSIENIEKNLFAKSETVKNHSFVKKDSKIMYLMSTNNP